jgi:4-diphosphocytidyl-2-C-methyl-D-erythritol kinase
LIVFPNCKINLGLQILDKRPDGFHNLSTVFYPLPLKDALEILPNSTADQQVTFTSSGFAIDGDSSNNLCVKAYQLLQIKFPQLPYVAIHLHKSIPMGAGLGGGSADASFTLTLLNKQFKLGLDAPTLWDLALELGSDCPFFIHNSPCLATGRGEIITPINLNLNGYSIIVINPGIHVNTAWAFKELSQYKALKVRPPLIDIIQSPIENWKNNLINDFELPIINTHPAIGEIKETLYQNGASYAAMSGSGSSVFGLFKTQQPPKIAVDATYFSFSSTME